MTDRLQELVNRIKVLEQELLPPLFLDLVVSICQMNCFPVYGITKVKRSDYTIIDRQHLNYLKLIEKITCCYCRYFTGLIGYVQEISGRTEQYWCPIKHAHRTRMSLCCYKNFLDYVMVRVLRKKQYNS